MKYEVEKDASFSAQEKKDKLHARLKLIATSIKLLKDESVQNGRRVNFIDDPRLTALYSEAGEIALADDLFMLESVTICRDADCKVTANFKEAVKREAALKIMDDAIKGSDSKGDEKSNQDVNGKPEVKKFKEGWCRMASGYAVVYDELTENEVEAVLKRMANDLGIEYNDFVKDAEPDLIKDGKMWNDQEVDIFRDVSDLIDKQVRKGKVVSYLPTTTVINSVIWQFMIDEGLINSDGSFIKRCKRKGINKEFKFKATDSSGRKYAYSVKPVKMESEGAMWHDAEECLAHSYLGIDKKVRLGKKDWKKSLRRFED